MFVPDVNHAVIFMVVDKLNPCLLMAVKTTNDQ